MGLVAFIECRRYLRRKCFISQYIVSSHTCARRHRWSSPEPSAMPCPHGKRRSRCKDCGGSGLCEHWRERTRCKDCGMAAAKMDGVASSDLVHRRRTKRKKGEDEQEQVVVLEGVEVDNKTSYANVHVLSGRLKPYQAQVLNRSGRKVCLGSFATAEEAALCIARSPEGKAAAGRAAIAARELSLIHI